MNHCKHPDMFSIGAGYALIKEMEQKKMNNKITSLMHHLIRNMTNCLADMEAELAEMELTGASPLFVARYNTMLDFIKNLTNKICHEYDCNKCISCQARNLLIKIDKMK